MPSNNIIGARAEEILANVWNQLQLSGYEDKLFSGVVFTGGGANLKNLEKAFHKVSKIEKVKTAKFVQATVHTHSDEPKKDGMHNTLLGLLAAGNENCCLQEVKPVQQQPAANIPPKPIDIFVDDEALKEQEAAARAAKAQREKEEKERKERDRKREQREKEEKKKKKKEGTKWSFGKAFEKTFSKISNEIFSDDDMK